MPIMEEQPPQSNPVDEARVAIWRLFQEGYVDEDMATAGLLAVDLGTRRVKRMPHRDRPCLRVRPGTTGSTRTVL